MIFRDFLYVDEGTVERILSGIEGGTYESTDESWTTASDSSESSPQSSADQGSSGLTLSSSSQQQRQVRQNAEARFSRLWKAIEDDSDEHVVDADALGPAMSNTEGFCRLQGHLSVPPFIALLASSAEILQLGRLGQQFGLFDTGADEMEKLEAAAAMKEMIKETIPVVLNLGRGYPKVALPLHVADSRVGVDGYIGRATIYGRIVDAVPKGSTFPLINIPGMRHIPQPSRQQRRAADRGKGGTVDDGGTELPGPVVVVKALAISQ